MPEPLLVFWETITFAGGPVGIEILLPWIFLLGGVSLGLRVGAAVAVATVTNPLLKWLFAEPRPFMVDGEVVALTSARGFGMPSGHAQGIAAAWGGLIVFGGPKLAWVAVPMILLTGWSRVVLGVHTGSQVAAGWLLGLAGLALVRGAWAPVVARFKRLGWAFQLLAAGLMVVTILASAWWIADGLRADFVAPPAWIERHSEASQRLGEPLWVEEGSEWIDVGTMIPRAASVLGLALCGMWVLRFGAVEPCSTRQRALNLLLGLPVVAGWSALWWSISGWIGLEWSEAIRRLGLPLLVGVGVPHVVLARSELGRGPAAG